jgi:hypothetical protein
MVRFVGTPQASGPAATRATDPAAARRATYGALPPRPALDELVEETPTDPPADPQSGRDTNRDWMLRYC